MVPATHRTGFAHDVAGQVCFLDCVFVLQRGAAERYASARAVPSSAATRSTPKT
jgi:ABC-type polar amino acid transport system ATPase subunit